MRGSWQCPTCGAYYTNAEYDALLDGECCDLPLRFVVAHEMPEFAPVRFTPAQYTLDFMMKRNRGIA